MFHLVVIRFGYKSEGRLKSVSDGLKIYFI